MCMSRSCGSNSLMKELDGIYQSMLTCTLIVSVAWPIHGSYYGGYMHINEQIHACGGSRFSLLNSIRYGLKFEEIRKNKERS